MIAACAGSALAQSREHSSVPAALAKADAVRALPLLPMSFEANRGQSDARVRFLSRGPGYTLFLTGNQSVLKLSNGKTEAALRLQFVDANRSAQLQGEQLLPLRSFYYIGGDPAKWQKNVPNYGRVVYRSVYPGVDVAFYGSQGKLENDFLLAPGADARRIQWELQGAKRAYVDAQGDVVLATSAGDVRLQKPLAYQEIGGRKQAVEVSYRVAGNRIAFSLGAYDRGRALVIDPVIDYLSYVTAGSSVAVSGVAVDGAGTTYIAGATTATSFPNSSTVNANTLAAGTNGYILKLAADGSSASLAIFFGGATAPTTVGGVAVGGSGSVYVAGSEVGNFPAPADPNFVTLQSGNKGGTDGYLIKFDSSGNILYSTLYGGSGTDVATAVAVFGKYAFLTGSTTSNSTAIPTHNAFSSSRIGSQDAFVAVINTNTASNITTTECIGSSTARLTFASPHGFSAGDRVLISGTDPTNNGTFDTSGTTEISIASVPTATTMTFSNSGCGSHVESGNGGGTVVGALQYGSYVGAASATVVGNGIVATNANTAYVTGNTDNKTFAGFASSVVGTGYAFVSKFDLTQTTTNTLAASTLLSGAAGTVNGNGITVDGSGNPIVVGSTTSNTTCAAATLPACTIAGQSAYGGGASDGYIAKLASNLGTVSWFSYLGDAGADAAKSVQVGSNGFVYVSGATGSSPAGSFFSGTNVVVGSLQGAQDGFVAVLDPSTHNYKRAFYLGGAGSQDTVQSLSPLTAGSIGSITMGTAGTKYFSTPTVTIAAPTTGTQATGTAIIGGQLTSIALNTAGSGYTHNVVCPLTIGAPAAGGTQATAVFYTNGGGTVTGTSITNPGSNYTSAPALTFSGCSVATAATGTATVSSGAGTVIGVAITNPGSGYTSTPTVTITAPGGGGTTATATAVRGPAANTLFYAGNTDSPAMGATATGTYQPTPDAGAPTIMPGVSANAGAFAGRISDTFGASAFTLAESVADANGLPIAAVGYSSGTGTTVKYTYTITPTSGTLSDFVFNWPTPVAAGASPSNGIVALLDGGGSGYTTNQTLTIGAPNAAGGTQAAGTAVINSAIVTSLNITNPGSGYTSDPTLTIPAPGGAGTTATAHALAGLDPLLAPSGAPVVSANGGDVITCDAPTAQGVTCRAAAITTAQTITITADSTSSTAVNGSGLTVITNPTAGASNAAPPAVTLATALKAAPVVDMAVTAHSITPDASGAGQPFRVDSDATLEWDVTVNNTSGATSAPDVQVVVTLPSGVTGIIPTANTAANCPSIAINSNQVTCTVGAVAAGGSYTIKLTATPPALSASAPNATLADTVSIISQNGGFSDPAAGNSSNVASLGLNSFQIEQRREAAITVTAAAQTNPVREGTAITGGYAITVHNAGPSNATNVVFSMTLDTSLTSGGANGATNFTGISITPSTGCTVVGQVVSCNLATLNSGAANDFTAVVSATTPNAINTTANSQTFSQANGATVAQVTSTSTMDSSDKVLSVANANAPTDTTTTVSVQRWADLGIGTVTDDSPVSKLGPLHITVPIRANNTFDDGEGVAVDFVLASNAWTVTGSTFPSLVNPCTQTGGTANVHCVIGHLAKSASYQNLVLAVTPDPALAPAPSVSGASTTTSVTISGNNIEQATADDGPVNDVATIAVVVNLSVALSDNTTTTNAANPPASVRQGQGNSVPLHIIGTVNNAGPDAEATGTLTFTLPSNLFLMTASQMVKNSVTTNTICNQAGGSATVTCNIGGLTASGGGSSAVITITVTPDPNLAIGTANFLKSVATQSTAAISSADAWQSGTSAVPNVNAPAPVQSTIARTVDLQNTSSVDNTTAGTRSPLTGTVTYTTVFTNAGPDDVDLSSVAVFYTFPTAGYTLQSNTYPGGCAYWTGSATSGTPQTMVRCLPASASSNFANGSVFNTTNTVSITPDNAWVGAGTSGLATKTINVVVSSAQAYDNGANGAPAVLPGPPSDNQKNVSTFVQRKADLTVVTPFTDGTSPANPAPLTQALAMSTNINNAGPDPAKNVTLTYTLPTGGYAWSNDNIASVATGASCTHTSGTVTCTIPTLATGPLSFVLNVMPDSSTTNVPTTVSTPPNPQKTTVAVGSADTVSATNNSQQLTSSLERTSDLFLSSSWSSNSPVSITGPGQLTITTPISNNQGPDAAPNVVVVYSLPSALWQYAGTTSFPGGCVQGPAGYATNQVVCKLFNNTTSTLAKNASSTQTVAITPDPALSSGSYSVDAVVTTYTGGTVDCCVLDKNLANSTTQPNNLNGPSTLSVTIQRKADLQITAESDAAGSTSPTPGAPTSNTNPSSLSQVLTLKTTVKNNGPDSGAGQTVTYTFPTAGYSLQSFTGYTACNYWTGVAISVSPQTMVQCAYADGTPAVGGSANFTISIVPDPAWVGAGLSSASVSVSATVAGNLVDPGPGANTLAFPSWVGRIGSLSVTWEGDAPSPGPISSVASPVPLAGPLTLYTTVQNASSDAVSGFTVDYNFPTNGFLYQGTNTYGASNACVASTTHVVCTVSSTLGANTSSTYSLTVKPDPNWIPSNQQTNTQSISATVAYVFNTLPNNSAVSAVSTFGRFADVDITPNSLSDTAPATSPHPGQPSAANNPVPLVGQLQLNTGVTTSAAIANAVVTYLFPTSGFTLGTNTYSGGCVTPSVTGAFAGNPNTVDCTVSTLTTTGNFSVKVTPDPAWVPANQATALLPIGVTVTYPLNQPSGSTTGTINSTVGRIANLQLTTLTDNSASVSNAILLTTPSNGTTKVVPLAGPLVYTASVKNLGPDVAVGDVSHLLQVTFTLPNANYQLIGNTFAGGSGCSQNSNTVVCDLGPSLAVNTPLVGTITVTPDPNLAGAVGATYPNQLSNAVISSADVFDNGTSSPGAPAAPGGDNTLPSPLNTTMARFTSLSLAGGIVSGPTNVDSTGPNFAGVGSTVTYALNVANATNTTGGLLTSAAAGVNVDITFPAGFVGASTSSPNWNCIFTNHPSCLYSGTIAPNSSVPLVISGNYSDNPALNPLPGGGTYNGGTSTYLVGQGNGGTITATPGTTASSNPDTLTAATTSSNIERVALLSVTQQVVAPAIPGAVPLGQPIVYSFQVGNAGQCGPSVNCDKATGIDLQVTFPAGFQGPPGFTVPQFASQPSGAWSCTWTANTLLADCKLTSLDPGVLSDTLTVTGSYSTGLNLASGSGQLQVTASGNVVTTGSINAATPQQTAVSVAANIQRSVDLAAALTATPVVGGAAVLGQTQGGDPAKNTVTYAVSISNGGANDASGGSTTDFNAVQMAFSVGALASHFNLNPVAAPSGVTCTTGQGTVNCHYANQATGAPATVIQITGQFDSTVSLSGSALSTATASVSSTDSKDANAANDTATSGVTVVDTPVSAATGGSLALRSDTGSPTQVLYASVTTAGVTTQSVVSAAPSGYVEPAATATADYSTATPQYEVVGMDPTLPVQYSGAVTVCVAFTPSAFVNPSRVRLFEQTGADITISLNTTTGLVCGSTTTIPNVFTVREPKEHLPVAKLAATQLVVGGGAHQGTSNQFTIDAGGSTDPDFQQLCNGSNAHTSPQYCGDTLTYTIKGPLGMGISSSTSGATWSPDFSTATFVVAPGANGTAGAAPSFVGTFPVGVSAVVLVITDQTGQVVAPTQTASVNVALNSFTLGGGNTTSATITAGQSTNFQFSPQQSINGIQLPATFSGTMTLACTGVKDDNGSTLAQNGMTCTMSPTTITQGESASVLITTTGPNFSLLHPVKPGSNHGTLVAVLAMMSFPAFGFVLLPMARRNRKGAALLLLLLAGLLMLQTACGGGATQPVAQTVAKSTPSGSYTITVTGTAGSTVSTSTFKVTVQ